MAGTGHQEVCHRRCIVRSGAIAVLLYPVKAQAGHVNLESARQELDIGATPLSNRKHVGVRGTLVAFQPYLRHCTMVGESPQNRLRV